MGWTRARWIMMGVAIAGCGPAVALDDDGGTGSSGDVPSTTATTVGPGSSTTTTPGTTTSATTVDPNDPTTGPEPTTGGDEWDEDDCGEGCCDFLCAPDGGNDSTDCDIWAQDCPENEKCMPWANDGGDRWNATRCSPIAASPRQVGDSCMVEGSAVSGIDDCDKGLMCFFVDPLTNTGSCVADCTNSEANPVCDDPGTECVIDFEGTFHECLPSCDPLLADCDHGKCSAHGQGDVEGFACTVSLLPSAADFTPCTHDWECMPGSLCVDGDQAPACDDGDCCAPFCDVTDPGACDEGFVCTLVYERGQFPPGFETYGYCALP